MESEFKSSRLHGFRIFLYWGGLITASAKFQPKYPRSFGTNADIATLSLGQRFLKSRVTGSWAERSKSERLFTFWRVDWRSRPAAVYAGTTRGVFYSTDLGMHWSLFGQGLPRTMVMGLQILPGNGVLVAATFGRGVYQTASRVPTGSDHAFSSSRRLGCQASLAVSVTAYEHGESKSDQRRGCRCRAATKRNCGKS